MSQALKPLELQNRNKAGQLRRVRRGVGADMPGWHSEHECPDDARVESSKYPDVIKFGQNEDAQQVHLLLRLQRRPSEPPQAHSYIVRTATPKLEFQVLPHVTDLTFFSLPEATRETHLLFSGFREHPLLRSSRFPDFPKKWCRRGSRRVFSKRKRCNARCSQPETNISVVTSSSKPGPRLN
jgi:hypothetical protein